MRTVTETLKGALGLLVLSRGAGNRQVGLACRYVQIPL